MSHKLTPTETAEARHLYQMGWSKSEIARHLGVTHVAVNYHVGYLRRYTAKQVLSVQPQLREAA